MRPVQNIITFYNDSLIRLRNIEIFIVLIQKAEYSLVKDLGILVGNEVIAGNDGKLGRGNGFCNKSGMGIFYHIVIAGYDKGWRLYLWEFIRLHVWIVDH